MARLSADGTTILENYDRFTGVSFNANVTSIYANGSIMDDSKVDNCIYFKNRPELGGGYSVRSEFIENRTVNVTWFGAIGKSGIDNAGAFEKIENFLINCAPDSAGKLTLLFPNAQSGYVSSRPLHVTLNVNVVMNTGVIYAGEFRPLTTFLKIGEYGQTNARLNHKLDVRSSPVDWSSPDLIGIEIINSYESTGICIDRANGFTEGVRFIGDDGGCVYNKIFLGQLQNNKIPVKLTNRNTGWCNESIFFGGRFQTSSDTYITQDRYGVIIDSEDGLYGNNNNNNFYEPSFEISSNPNVETIPILIRYGSQNAFYNVRNENGDHLTCVMRTLNTSYANILELGFNTSVVNFGAYVQDNGNFPTSNLTSRNLYLLNNAPKIHIYGSGNLTNRLFSYDGTSVYSSDELWLVDSATGTRDKIKTGITIDMTTDSVLLPSSKGVSVRIDTRVNKRFVINKVIAVGSAGGGRTSVRPLDASKAVIIPDSTPLVKGYPNYVPGYNVAFGGVYRQGSDSAASFYVVLDSSVKYMDVILSGGSVPVNLKSFDIEAIDASSTCINDHLRKGLAAPTEPTTTGINTGVLITKTVPTGIGDYAGWVNTSDGWHQYGQIGEFGLGINAATGLMLSDNNLNSTNHPSGIYAIVPSTTGNPTTSSGSVIIEKSGAANFVTQKFQAINAANLCRLFIRHYSTTLAAWTDWFEIYHAKSSLDNYIVGADVAIGATDTILQAFGKTQGQLNIKAPLASPTITGIPTAPTAPIDTNNNQIATTAFVNNEIDSIIKYGNIDLLLDGTSTVYYIPHHMGSTPTSFSITFGDPSVVELVSSIKTLTSTDIVLSCLNPPATDTVKIYWQVFK